MSVKVFYTTKATAKGGRNGTAGTDDGSFKVTLAKPKEMGGSGEGNNPEQLFASGYAACFLGAMQFVAGQLGYELSEETTVSATVGIGARDAGGFGLTVSLEVGVPSLSKAEAEELVRKAHEVCPYSNATRGNIDVALSVK